MMTGNMQNLTNFFFTCIYLRKELSKKEKADIIILSSLLVAYFIGCVVSSILLNIRSGNPVENARYATLGLLIAVVITLFASKAYVVLECDKSSCLHDSCPTSQFIFENSAQIHHYCMEHLHARSVEHNDHISRDVESVTEITRQGDVHVHLPPKQ